MEIQLRGSLDKAKQAKQNAHGIPPFAAMLFWGQKIFNDLCKRDDFALFLQYAWKDPEGFKKTRDVHQIIYDGCMVEAYNFYCREIGREPVVLGENEQEAFLRELQEIENDKVYLKAQAAKDAILNPIHALERDRTMALESHFYILPRDNRNAEPEDGIMSRISLSVKPSQVVNVAKLLADEMGGKFNDLFSEIKVLAANEHGRSPDNIVIYLDKTDPIYAKQFSEHLYASIPTHAWEQQSPLGMHAFFPGIAYGESPPESNSSFGLSRAKIVAKAILKHLTDQTPLDDAMKEALRSNKCSLKNPAFVERPELKDILSEL